MSPLELAWRIAVGLAGAFVVARTVLSAIRTVAVPRAVQSSLTRVVFLVTRGCFMATFSRDDPYEVKDRRMAFYAPLSLTLLPAVWLTLTVLGFTAIFLAITGEDVVHAFELSGSSVTTLGFVRPKGFAATTLAFLEAGIGLFLLALLITFLPSMYAAFARRELMVASLEIPAGAPPSPITMIERFHALRELSAIDELWPEWTTWFADIEESHTSLPALPFFRSPQPDRSWVTAAGCILDAAAVRVAVLDLPPSPDAQLLIRAGFVSLRRIADYFGLPYDAEPAPDDDTSIGREEFDAACAELEEAGIRLRPREEAWDAFNGWRVNYDEVLLGLAGLTITPPARWSGDRASAFLRPPLRKSRIRGLGRTNP